MEARLWCSVICGEVPAPTSEAYYKLLQPKGARITHGVDYSSYVSQLARDVGSQPGLLDLWRTHGFDILLIYCFAAAFPTLYSLTGPWASAQAPHITRTEIRETIARRGVGGNVLMGVIPMVFYGFVNLAALLLEQLLNVAQALMPKTCQAAARQLGWTQHKKMA
jgi:dimethylaniline monooxygenase (N-oxide forming)